MEVDHAALLEWINSLEAVGRRRIARLEDLSDGALLLAVMQDLNSEGFRETTEHSSQLLCLLTGLLEHFKGREGAGEVTARKLLSRAERGSSINPSKLTCLVIWATVDNDLPGQQRYVEVCQQLSSQSQEVVMMIVNNFQTMNFEDVEEEDGQSRPSSPSNRRPLSGFAASDGLNAEHGLPDFLEVGLDAETRFRRLKEHYIFLKEEQERMEEERSALRFQIEAEVAKRIEAEQAERIARAELKSAEEEKTRIKEDQRALFELRLEQEVAARRKELQNSNAEAEGLREELEIARNQAQSAQKLASQLEMFKKKLEDCQAWKREKEDLRQQLDELLNSRNSATGSSDQLQKRLSSLREELALASNERDEAQLQLRLVRKELDETKAAAMNAAEENRDLRRGKQVQQQPPSPSNSGVHGENLAAVESRKAGDNSHKESSVEGLLERLLQEKERATRAETTLQLKQNEVSELEKLRSKDAATITSLESQLSTKAAAAEGPPANQDSVDSAVVKELQSQLSLRERELQVYNWRSQAESTSLLAQETLMSACFHELGLRYQQLKVKYDLLQRRPNESS